MKSPLAVLATALLLSSSLVAAAPVNAPRAHPAANERNSALASIEGVFDDFNFDFEKRSVDILKSWMPNVDIKSHFNAARHSDHDHALKKRMTHGVKPLTTEA